jgi:hypothetical protein
MFKTVIFFIISFFFLSSLYPEEVECKVEQTKLNDPKAVSALEGLHNLSLQWIESKYGKLTITRENEIYSMNGKQNNPKNDDLLTINGIITEINSKSFKFCGTIVTKITHLNNAQECSRSGLFTFAIRGKRKYWRLQEKTNPCETGGVVDYIDVFFKIRKI